MKVESGHEDIDFHERRQPVVPPCPVCGRALIQFANSLNYACVNGHQTTANRLREASA